MFGWTHPIVPWAIVPRAGRVPTIIGRGGRLVRQLPSVCAVETDADRPFFKQKVE
jgi:hypothetical protein